MSHMRNRIRLRFAISYLIFGFISIFIIFLVSSEMYKNVLLKDASDSLYRQSLIVANNSGREAFAKDDKSLERRLEQYCTANNSAIWIVDTEGKVMVSAGGTIVSDQPGSIPEFNPEDFTSTEVNTGDFYGTLSEECITAVSPVTNGFKTLGYVIMHQPVGILLPLVNSMLRIGIISFAIIFPFSLIIVCCYLLFVEAPLRKIIKAAREYSDGNLTYHINVDSRDEMGYLADSLNTMSTKVNEMEETQKKFIANISHDFRSPLTCIKGYSQAIVDGTIPPEMMDKYLNIIIFETERLTDLTEDLLTLSNFELKGMNLNIEAFDINQAIKNTVASFEGICRQHYIQMELLFADRENLVKADSSKIQQVLHNLLDNAIKFSPDDSVITVETTRLSEKLRISVKDHGIGISKESLPKIWDRFYKSDSSRGMDKKGTGLGLSIVKDIISAHGETINVISTENAGTEFIFHLPLA